VANAWRVLWEDHTPREHHGERDGQCIGSPGGWFEESADYNDNAQIPGLERGTFKRARRAGSIAPWLRRAVKADHAGEYCLGSDVAIAKVAQHFA